MTTKKVQTPRPKGKARGDARHMQDLPKTPEQRARAIVADVKGYDEETRRVIKRALETHGGYLIELVRRAEAGEAILTPQDPPDAEGEGFKQAALDYAGKAYTAALAHYAASEGDAFARSRLAVVYGEQAPGDLNIVVTLPGVVDGKDVTEAQAREVVKDAELLARTLEHPDCPDAFKTAFGAIFAEHILDGSEVGYETPAVVRVMLPLALLEQWRHHDGSGVTPTEILITLSSELVGDEVDRDVRASLGMQ